MISIKERVENNAVVFVLTVATVAFASGWAAHYAVQSAAGRVAVSVETARRAEAAEADRQLQDGRYAQLEKQYIALQSELKSVRNMKPIAPASAASASPSNITASASEAKPVKRVPSKVSTTEPAPISLGYAYVSGGWFRDAKIDEKIEVSVDYVVKPGYSVRVWVHPSSPFNCEYSYEPSDEVKGSGRLSRWFSSSSECTVDEVLVSASSDDDSKFSSVNRRFRAGIAFKK